MLAMEGVRSYFCREFISVQICFFPEKLDHQSFVEIRPHLQTYVALIECAISCSLSCVSEVSLKRNLNPEPTDQLCDF